MSAPADETTLEEGVHILEPMADADATLELPVPPRRSASRVRNGRVAADGFRPAVLPLPPPVGPDGEPSAPLLFVPPPAGRRTGVAARLAARLAGVAVPAVDALAVATALAVGAVPGPRIAAAVVATFAVVALAGGYRPRMSGVYEQVPGLLGHVAVALVAVALVTGDGDATQLLRWAPLAAALVVAGRALSFGFVRMVRARGAAAEPTLIIGAGGQGVQLADSLRRHPEYGLVPVGFLDSIDEVLSPPILGDLDALDTVLRNFAVRRVIVAFGRRREADLVRVLRSCEQQGVAVSVLPRFFELGAAPVGHDADEIWGTPVVSVRRAALGSTAWRTKRVFDLVLAVTGLVLTLPVMALAAVAVRATDGGPVLFRQRRVGQRGRLFEVLKFRTLPVNGDSETTWSVENDPRVTRVGRLLRRTSIDELPQLWNVLRGDMSMVGPRPERPFFVDRYGVTVPSYGDRHRVPVGITGWAQVHGLRGDTSIEERTRFDNYYIEHWSLWRDVVIVVRTVGAVVRHPRRQP